MTVRPILAAATTAFLAFEARSAVAQDDVPATTAKDPVAAPAAMTSSSVAESGTPASRPTTLGAEPPKPLVGVVGGAVIGNFFGLPNARGQVGLAMVIPMRIEPIGARIGFDWEPGSTEYGLQMHRLAASLGFETFGRFRLGAGVQLPYTFVLRKTKSAPFTTALFGNIGGFGIGVHGSFWIDVVRTEGLTLMLGVRGDYETYFTGTGRQASASLGVYF